MLCSAAMKEWLTIDGDARPVIREQMARAYRGCRMAAILLLLTLLLLIGGTFLTIMPLSVDEDEYYSGQSPLQTLGLVLLILGCGCAAGEVVLVVTTIVLLKNVKTFNSDQTTRSNRTATFRPQFITFYGEQRNQSPAKREDPYSDYKILDFSRLQYSALNMPKKSSGGGDEHKECQLL